MSIVPEAAISPEGASSSSDSTVISEPGEVATRGLAVPSWAGGGWTGGVVGVGEGTPVARLQARRVENPMVKISKFLIRIILCIPASLRGLSRTGDEAFKPHPKRGGA
jgi:hypothetical protein